MPLPLVALLRVRFRESSQPPQQAVKRTGSARQAMPQTGCRTELQVVLGRARGFLQRRKVHHTGLPGHRMPPLQAARRTRWPPPGFRTGSPPRQPLQQTGCLLRTTRQTEFPLALGRASGFLQQLAVRQN
jgi:hypothetical protein